MSAPSFHIELLPGARRLLAAHSETLPQRDDLCGAFCGALALHAARIDSHDGQRVDQDAVALAAGTVVSALPDVHNLPRGEHSRRDYRLALPLVDDADVSGTTAGGLARAVEQLSDGALAAIPYEGPWTADALAGTFDLLMGRERPVALVANLATRHLWGAGASVARMLDYLFDGTQDGPPPDWDVGHFVCLIGRVRGPRGSLYGVADTYASLGSRGVHMQPGERLVRALQRPQMAAGGLLVIAFRAVAAPRGGGGAAPGPPGAGGGGGAGGAPPPLRARPQRASVGQRHDLARDARVSADELIALVCCDLGAIVRGRSLQAAELGEHLNSGIGWVPANHSLTPLGTLAEESPFGSTGDLRLLPDIHTRARVGGDERARALELVLCDIVETDGRPWVCCPRRFLREALDQLREEFGLHLRSSFEHEFQLLREDPPALPFSLEAERRAEPFASDLMAALAEAGAEPERFFAEFAPHQYEIPVAAAEGMTGADRSVVLREIVREIARRHELRASFVPLLDPASAGNGVHIHIGLLGADGEPVLYERGQPAHMSALGLSFAAGVLAHARALSALTAPSPVSSARLAPHHWSAGAVALGERNREALLRIPPLVELGGLELASQLRLEYRGADASANPYLALGAILRAGLDGIRAALPPPPILERDPGELDELESARFGVGALPASLEDALQALAHDETVRGWMHPQLYDAYVGIKHAELEYAGGLDLDEVCRRYGAIY